MYLLKTMAFLEETINNKAVGGEFVCRDPEGGVGKLFMLQGESLLSNFLQMVWMFAQCKGSLMAIETFVTFIIEESHLSSYL